MCNYHYSVKIYKTLKFMLCYICTFPSMCHSEGSDSYTVYSVLWTINSLKCNVHRKKTRQNLNIFIKIMSKFVLVNVDKRKGDLKEEMRGKRKVKW